MRGLGTGRVLVISLCFTEIFKKKFILRVGTALIIFGKMHFLLVSELIIFVMKYNIYSFTDRLNIRKLVFLRK